MNSWFDILMGIMFALLFMILAMSLVSIAVDGRGINYHWCEQQGGTYLKHYHRHQGVCVSKAVILEEERK